MLISANDHHRLSANQLSLWLNYIEHQVGFVLPPSQVNWVKGIIERHLQSNQMTSTELLEAIAKYPKLYHQLFDDILIPRTQFFRHLPSFDYIAQYATVWQHQQHLALAAHAVAANPPFTAWSVGCSTGQEAVSIALTLKQCLSVGQDFLVYGSDFHQKSLQRARQGDYDNQELKFIPERFHSLLTIETGLFYAKDEVKQRISYFSQNLIETAQPLTVGKKQCQIILCKNVLIYFRQFEQRDIIHALLQYLDDDGILIFGVGELLQLGSLPVMRLPVSTVNAYCKTVAADWVKQLKL